MGQLEACEQAQSIFKWGITLNFRRRRIIFLIGSTSYLSGPLYLQKFFHLPGMDCVPKLGQARPGNSRVSNSKLETSAEIFKWGSRLEVLSFSRGLESYSDF